MITMPKHTLYRLGTQMYLWWTRVPTPRAISVITAVAYAASVFTGVVTLLMAPQVYAVVGGAPTLVFASWFWILGGLIGMVAGTFEFWQLERVAIATISWALVSYAYVVIALQLDPEIGGQSSRLTQFGVILIALAFLATRMAMIWRYPFKPRGGDDSD